MIIIIIIILITMILIIPISRYGIMYIMVITKETPPMWPVDQQAKGEAPF